MALGDLSQSLAADPTYGTTDPEDIKRRQLLAQQLMNRGTSAEPIRSPWQGASNLAGALFGGLDAWKARSDKQAAQNAATSASDPMMKWALGGAGNTASASSPSPVAQAPTPSANVSDRVSSMLPMFAQAAGTYGVTPDYLAKTAQIESSGNPNADNGIARGLFQFTGPTARQYGLSNPFDPQASTMAAAKLAAANKASLTQSLGREPTDAELYLAHQQGAGGAAKLLANPNAPAASIVGAKAVTMNGGSPDMTAGQFANMWLQKFNRVGNPQGTPNQAPTQVASSNPGFVPQGAGPVARTSTGAPVATDANGNALQPNGQPTAMAYAAPEQPQGNPLANAPLPPARPASVGGTAPDDGEEESAAPTPNSAALTGARAQTPTSEAAPAPRGVQVADNSKGVAYPTTPQPAPRANANIPPEVLQSAIATLKNPWSSAASQQIAKGVIDKAMAGQQPQKFGAPYLDGQGNLVQQDTTGQIHILNKASEKDNTPQSVREYEYGLTHPDFVKQKQQMAAPPATVQEYQYYQKQEQDAGREPMSFGDYQKQKALKFANFENDGSHELVASLAARALAGDNKWKVGLSKEPGLIRAVETEVAKGGSPDQIAQRILQAQANQVGRTQQMRTLGSATANNALYGNTANAAIDTAISASRDVPRTSWLPINQLMQAGQKAASDPKLARLQAATNTLVNEYAKATTPTGQPTDSQRNHAFEMLNQAQSPEVYEAVSNMLRTEIANTHRGIEDTNKQLQSGRVGEPMQSALPPGGPAVPGSQSRGVMDSIIDTGRWIFGGKNGGATSNGVKWSIEGQ